MAGFNKDLDEIMWESEPASDGFTVRVMKYGPKGKPKIAFVRKYEDHEGEPKEKNGGRLFIQDVEYFGAVWPEARKVMRQMLSNDPSFNKPHPDEIDPDDVLYEEGISVYDIEE